MKNPIHLNYHPTLLALFTVVLCCLLSLPTYGQKQNKQQIQIVDPYSGQLTYADAHIVQHGETLFGISRKYKMTIDELKILNTLKSDLIHAGDMLAISSPKVAVQRSSNSNKRIAPTPDLGAEFEEKKEIAQASSPPVQLYKYSRSNSEAPFDWEAPSPEAPDYSYLEKRRGEVTVPLGTATRRLPSQDNASIASQGIPRASATNKRLASAERESAPTGLRRTYHEVRSGENIYAIADQYGVSVDELREANGVRAVLPGQTLVINPPVSRDDREELLASQNRESSFRLRSVRAASDPFIEEDEAWRDEPLFTSLDVLNENSTSLDVLNPEMDPTRRFQRARGEDLNESVKRGGTPSDLSPRPKAPAVKTSAPPASMLINGAEAMPLGDVIEVLTYGQYENFKFRDKHFYAVHKELPIGTKMRMPIPQNGGFVEVEVVARLSPTSKYEIGLSPNCIRLLRNGENKERVTLFYDMVN